MERYTLEEPGLNALFQMQEAVGEWSQYNFPHQSPQTSLNKLVSEVGELCDAVAMTEQGIKGFDNPAHSAHQRRDAVGDILICLLDYCYRSDIFMGRALRDAWNEVKERDWVRYPQKGKPTHD